MADLDAALGRQLEMNAESWRALQAHGVVAGTPLRVDFFFYTRSPAGAKALAQELRSGYGYEAEARRERGTWKVLGRTPPTPVSHEWLDAWVEAMVRTGAQHAAEFDGWGAAAG
jgi:hypothetical protein